MRQRFISIAINIALALVAGTTIAAVSKNTVEPNAAMKQQITTKAQLLSVVANARTDKEALGPLVKRFPASERAGSLAELTKLLQSPSWEVRVNAAYVLGEFGPSAMPAAPALVESMRTAKMENVAWEVIPALKKIGPGAVAALKDALRKAPLSGPDPYHLIGAATALRSQAKELAPYIVPYLRDGDNTGAVKALIAIGPSSIDTVCSAVLDDKEGFIVVYAPRVLSTFNLRDSTNGLLSKLKQAPPKGRKNISYVLANLKPAPDLSAAPALCMMLKDDNWDVRNNASQALKNIGAKAVPDITELLSDKNPTVYLAATAILKELGPSARAALPALSRMMASPELEVSGTAASTILRIDPKNALARQRLEAYLRSKDEHVRAAATEHLAQSGTGASQTVPALIKGLTDASSPVREKSAIALGSLGPLAKAAVPALMAAATASHPPVDYGRELMGMDDSIQRAAITAIGKIGPGASAAIPTLIKILQNESKSFLHEYSLNALLQMKTAASPATPSLVALLKGNNNRTLVIATLASIGPGAKQALPLLRQMLNNESSSGRKELFEAIQHIETSSALLTQDAERLLRDSNPELQDAATKVLARSPSGNDATIKTLIAGMNGSYQNVRLSSIQALGSYGPKAAAALPSLINENIGSSFSQPQKDLSFAAIKRIDPSGEKTLAIVQPALKDCFKVRGAVELLEFIGSPNCKVVAAATRTKWKLN